MKDLLRERFEAMVLGKCGSLFIARNQQGHYIDATIEFAWTAWQAALAAAAPPPDRNDLLGQRRASQTPDRHHLASDHSGESIQCPHAWAAGSGGFRHCLECGERQALVKVGTEEQWRRIRATTP